MKAIFISWFSTYKDPLQDYLGKLPEKCQKVISILWVTYRITQLLKSSYFSYIEVGDGWHTLQVRKYANDTWSVKYNYNPNYGNGCERFTTC